MKPLFVLFLLAMFALGIGCVFFPRDVQLLAVKAVGMGMTSRHQALMAFVQSRSYLISVRAVGVIALLVALFLAFASFKGS
jgi:hypothetical protein